MPRYSLTDHRSRFVATLAAALTCLAAAVIPLAAQSYSTTKLADGFDYPVGKPDGAGYYIFRGFSPNGHLGEDWNGNGGGDTDEGDPVYSIAHGVVVFSENYEKGWGNVVIIRHAYRERNGQIAFIDSLYGHLKVRSVSPGQQVSRGQLVGTIGCGPYRMYAAHLHFEIRKDLRVGMRRDLYPRTYETYHVPRQFMDQRRSLRLEARTVRVPINTFLKSNPNRMTTDEVEIPELTTTGETMRPKLPEELGVVIEEETQAEAATPEKSKTLFEAFIKKLSNPQ